MRTLTIGSTTLEINSFRKIRDKVVGVYAQIEIPVTAISYEEVNALFKNNQHDLIVTEEDGSTTTYSGYNKWDETKEREDFYTVIQICESEAIHLLNEARKEIETLRREKAELQSEVMAQATVLETHATVITQQNSVITAQGNRITEQQTALDNYAKVVVAQVDNIATLEAQNKELNETVNALLGMEE